MKHFHITLSLWRLTTGILALALICTVMTHQVGQGSAATSYNHNPMGTADYCALSGSTTIIYGWAYDADAPAGAQPYVGVNIAGHNTQVASDIAGYRDAAINTYIHSHNPGAPTSSVYGWKLSLVGYYKGGRYTVSGTLDNYGSGGNVGLPINTASHVDGDASKPYFSGGVIPDACLASAPAPAPAPAPTPVTTPSSGSSSGTKRPSSSSGVAAPATPAPSANADATVVTGTTAVTIAIPAEGASKVHVTYIETGGLSLNSDDQDVSGDSATVTLQGLDAASDYNFQIVRTNSAGTAATSTAANFTTKGYTVALTLKNSQKKPVVGISGTINDPNNTKIKTDKNGLMSFGGLGAGSYTVSYVYKGHTYTQDFDTTTDTSDGTNTDGSPQVITLSSTINVDNLAKNKQASSSATRHSAVGLVIMLLLLMLAAVGGGLWFFLRRRHNNQLLAEYSALGAPTATGLPGQPAESVTLPHESGPLPAHAGESLRDMVLESMHNQAAQQPLGSPEGHLPAIPALPETPPAAPLAINSQPPPAPVQPPAPIPEPTPPTQTNSVPPPLDDGNGTIRIRH